MTASAIAVAICLAAPARADRHCAPALEHYYGARHAILSQALLPGHNAEDTCEAGASEAIPRLEESAIAARNCGCGAFRERIEEVTDQARSTASCPSRLYAVLEAKSDLEGLAEACH